MILQDLFLKREEVSKNCLKVQKNFQLKHFKFNLNNLCKKRLVKRDYIVPTNTIFKFCKPLLFAYSISFVVHFVIHAFILDPWQQPEGSYEMGFVLPSKRFLEIRLLVFSKFWHGVRNPYEVVLERARFFGKFFYPKNEP